MAESPLGSQLSPHQSPGQPSRSSSTTPISNVQTIDQARAELEARLSGIHNDLQLTQRIGLLFVKREDELKSCYEQLQQLNELEEQQTQEGDDEDAEAKGGSRVLPESFREQLNALDKDFQEGENGIAGLKKLIDAQLPSDSNAANDLQSSRSASVLGPSALPSSALPTQTISKPRRHKVVMNSGPAVSDAAFPLQIQEELLNQVRYWTSQAEMKEKLNQEYDTKINEQERIIDALNKQRRLREEAEERQKEDQWNLELQNQDLRNQNAELQAQLSKAMHENGKIQKAFTTATEQVEQLKDKEEKTTGQMEVMKSRFEQDIAALRKHVSGVQREKSELLTKVDELNDAISAQQLKLSKKATVDAIAAAQELEEKEQENKSAPPILIQSPPRIPTSEDTTSTTTAAASQLAVEPKIASLARETSFAHQQSIISELQTKLNKEITEKEELITAKEELLTEKEELLSEKEELLSEKEELVKMLADREETIETMRLEGVAAFEPDSLSNKSSLALLGAGNSSKHPSELGLLDEAEAADHRDLSMTLSENSSHEFSNGRSSPFPAGGLFAELAQATSQQTIIKPPVECKDQEIMTEPIESWIRTVPGLTEILKDMIPSHNTNEKVSDKDEKVSTTDEKVSTIDEKVSTEVSDNALEKSIETDLHVSESSVITGKPGTQTKRIEQLQDILKSQSIEVQADAQEQVDAQEQGDVQEQGDDELPMPRARSGSVIDEERRHTCDMSQIISEPAAVPPPVPEVPKELTDEHQAVQSQEDREFRVSFGSAFGRTNATDTGKIRSIYIENKDTDKSAQIDQSVEESNKKPAEKSTEPSVAAVAAVAAVAGVVAATASVASKTTDHKDSSSHVDAADSKHTGVSSTTDVADTKRQDNFKKEVNVTSAEPNQTTSEKSEQEIIVSPVQDSTRPATTMVSVSSHTTFTYNQNTSQPALPNHPNGSQHHHVITDATGTTIGRHPNYQSSPNGSISTMSTDYNHGSHYRNGRRMSVSSNYEVTPTDPTMIQLITHTMIGDYLMKYTRRRMANMISEKSHRRYVWVHPYTKTVYWSMNNPGAEGSLEQRVKSAYIVAVFQEIDENVNSQNSDLPNVSLLVQTTSRNLKLKAPTRDKHDLWFQSINYLLSRPNTPGSDLPSDNQTWSEMQTGGARGPSNDAVLNLRQSEKAGNSLRNKSSLTRLQNMFGRNSVSKEGGANLTSGSTISMGSQRLTSARPTPGINHSGITTTAAATTPGSGIGNGNEKATLTNNIITDSTTTNGTLRKESIVALVDSRHDSSYKS
ncbi:hypothetical protein BGZ76_001349 [Entomortierella beljakovae]|nr:hypothetical protein BGZ76_001349 [Entomortierella beljakovae]